MEQFSFSSLPTLVSGQQIEAQRDPAARLLRIVFAPLASGRKPPLPLIANRHSQSFVELAELNARITEERRRKR
jgi:hypothetical protein